MLKPLLLVVLNHVTEAIQRAGLMTEIEGLKEIDDTHLWRIVSQLLHDF